MPLITRLASTNRSVSDDASASAASTAGRPRVPSPPVDIGARLTQTLHRGSSQDSRLLSSITGGATDADQARRSLIAPSCSERRIRDGRCLRAPESHHGKPDKERRMPEKPQQGDVPESGQDEALNQDDGSRGAQDEPRSDDEGGDGVTDTIPDA